jgi:hypothetical protein
MTRFMRDLNREGGDLRLWDLFAQFAVAVHVPGIVLSLERNEANGQMACCMAVDETRPLAERFVCVCVCVCVCFV